jgi:hypothetical protein
VKTEENREAPAFYLSMRMVFLTLAEAMKSMTLVGRSMDSLKNRNWSEAAYSEHCRMEVRRVLRCSTSYFWKN